MKQTKSAKPEERAIHFRLCHFCLHLNESVETIVDCGSCGQFYTTDLDEEVVEHADEASDSEESFESSYREGTAKGFVTITGLSGLF